MACGLAVTLAAGVLSVLTIATTPEMAGAATTPVAATWSSTPNCSTYVTATPPAGTVSATVTVNGGGGGGGNTNSGSGGTGGTGAQVSGTFNLTHNTGAVSVKLGCGGSGGTTGGGGGASINGAAGGAGYAAGAASGSATDESVSVDGIASGGGGGGASGLCLGTTGCTTLVAVAGGGGGGGSRWDCTGSDGPGTGGTGQSGGSGTISAGAAGTAGGDGSSNGGGGGGGGTSGGGSGGGGASHSGSTGANTPGSSTGGSGGAGGGGFPTEAGASGGGGGGGYTGGGGGGGDQCTSGNDTGGGGGGGSSAYSGTYSSSASYNAGGGTGGGTGASGGNGSVSLTWNLDNLSVTNPGSQTTTSGSAISNLTISAPHDTTGGNSVTFAATGLPSGLAINSATGVISGTPSAACACSVTVTATDSEALSASTTFAWTVTNTVTVTNPGSQSSLSGTAIAGLQLSATDSQSGATLTYTASGLPAGLSISTSGKVTGTPTTAGSGSVTVTATDGAGYHGSATFTWTVTNTVTVTGPGAQSDVSGRAITTVPVTGSDTSSTATLSYSDGGTLPPGLTIGTSTGSITGAPTTAGTYAVTITVEDNAGYTAQTSFSWVITNTLSVTSPGSQSDVSGSAITPLAIGASDSSSTATLAYSDGGTLPPGLTINASTGIVSGSPTIAGIYPVTITVTDSGGFSSDTTFTWTITNSVTVTNPGSQSSVSGAAIGALTVNATDSLQSATLSFADGGTLPPGLSIDPTTGTVTGTPTTAGTYPVTITVTDSADFAAQVTFTWTVTNTVSVSDPGNQSDVSGAAISALAVGATDSSATTTLSYSAGGTLPPGLAVSPTTGTVTGTPTTAGTYPVTVTATDGAGFAGTAQFTWTVTNTVSVSDPGNQSGSVGTRITALTVAGHDSSVTATLSYTATGLPSGLALDAPTGVISGVPLHSGVYAVTVTATDNAGFSASTGFSWTVIGPIVTSIKPATGPGAGGTKVTIKGSGFSGATSVDFGSVAATSFTVNHQGTKIKAVAPAQSAGTVDVIVTTAAGPSIPVTGDRFTYIAPSITRLAPASGSVAGGTKVVITGTGFTGATSVTFGPLPATSYKVNARGTEITAYTPAEPVATVNVTVTTPGGSDTASGAYTFD